MMAERLYRAHIGLLVCGLLAGVFTLATAAQPPPQEAYVDVPDARLWFTDTGGRGVPVVFLHANTGSSRVWDYQRSAFVARGFRVIAYDRRGFGRTVVTPDASPATGADDLLALADALKLDRFHLVGTAAGGFIAYDFALSFPQRLRSLVVANSIGGAQDPEFLELIRRLQPPPFASLPADVRELGPSYRAANPQGVEQWVELERTHRAPGTPLPAQPMRNRVMFAGLEKIALPVLILTGGADLYAPPPVVQQFAARIKGARFVVVPEAGHSAYWEQPDTFNREVLAFIARH
jgi:pimeloyl-ACP methyl ester carboxylesterase